MEEEQVGVIEDRYIHDALKGREWRRQRISRDEVGESVCVCVCVCVSETEGQIDQGSVWIGGGAG